MSMEFLGNPMEFLKVSLDLNGFAKEYNGLLKEFMNTHWDFHDLSRDVLVVSTVFHVSPRQGEGVC